MRRARAEWLRAGGLLICGTGGMAVLNLTAVDPLPVTYLLTWTGMLAFMALALLFTGHLSTPMWTRRSRPTRVEWVRALAVFPLATGLIGVTSSSLHKFTTPTPARIAVWVGLGLLIACGPLVTGALRRRPRDDDHDKGGT